MMVVRPKHVAIEYSGKLTYDSDVALTDKNSRHLILTRATECKHPRLNLYLIFYMFISRPSSLLTSIEVSVFLYIIYVISQ
jgi:hypothetical protein